MQLWENGVSSDDTYDESKFVLGAGRMFSAVFDLPSQKNVHI